MERCSACHDGRGCPGCPQRVWPPCSSVWTHCSPRPSNVHGLMGPLRDHKLGAHEMSHEILVSEKVIQTH